MDLTTYALLNKKIKKVEENGVSDERLNSAIDKSSKVQEISSSLDSNANKSNTYIDFRFNINKKMKNTTLQVIDVPTYVEKNNQIVHPSMLYFEKKWNGYNYWLSATPYTDTDSQYENPCIWVSENGIDWVVPFGVNNPLVPKPSSGYNADVNLFMDKHEEIMYIVYRVRDGVNRLNLISSTDGINWTTPKTILTMPTGQDCAVPNVWYENGKYYMTNIDLDQTDTNKRSVLNVYASDKVDGDWTKSHETQIPNIPSGKELWHYELRKIGGQYLLMYSVSNNGSYGSSGSNLYLASSKDLKTWATNSSPCIIKSNPTANAYKTTFVPTMTESGIILKVLYSETSWLLYYCEISVDLSYENEELLFERYYSDLSFDNFNKYTNGTSINTKQLQPIVKKQYWRSLAGDFIVNNGYASPNSNVNTVSVFSGIKSNNYIINTKVIHDKTKQFWIRIRNKDLSNCIRIGLSLADIVIQEIENGNIKSMLYNSSNNILNMYGDEIKISIKVEGDNISILLGDAVIKTVVSSFNNIYSSVGIQSDSVTEKVKYFSLKTFDYIETSTNYENHLLMINKLNQGLIKDACLIETFNRKDTVNDVGGIFTLTPSNTWGITNRQAYLLNTNNSFALADLNKANFTIEVTMANIPSNSTNAIVIRYLDANNFIRIVRQNTTTIVIQKIESGSATLLATKNIVASDELLKVIVDNDTITVYSEDIVVCTSVSSFNNACYKVGLQCSNTSARFKSFIAY